VMRRGIARGDCFIARRGRQTRPKVASFGPGLISTDATIRSGKSRKKGTKLRGSHIDYKVTHPDVPETIRKGRGEKNLLRVDDLQREASARANTPISSVL